MLDVWQRLDKSQRFKLVSLALKAPHTDPPDIDFLGDLSAPQQEFLNRALHHRFTPHTKEV